MNNKMAYEKCMKYLDKRTKEQYCLLYRNAEFMTQKNKLNKIINLTNRQSQSFQANSRCDKKKCVNQSEFIELKRNKNRI